MKKIFIYAGLILLFSTMAFSDVIRQSKSTVSFKGFGKYITKTIIQISGNQSVNDSKKSFKGKGFMGGMMAKFILKPGHTADIISLDSKRITQIDYKEKTIRTFAIDEMDWNNYGNDEDSGSEDTEAQDDDESSLRIIKNEFKVKKTGASKTINGFPTKEYLISWVLVWEDTESGDRGTDSLSSHVWTTKLTSKMQKAQQEENNFMRQYTKAAGFEFDMQSQEMLGTQWLSMFRGLNHRSDTEKKIDEAAWKKEMQKIKGYPVLTNGKYFTLRQKNKKEKVEPEKEDHDTPDFTSPKSVFGNIMKSAFKKNQKKSKKSKKAKFGKAAFSFRTELIKLESRSVPAAAFKIPEGYEDISKNSDR